MYVRKFESETIDGALKAIKQEFGPDAIILKTMTNKGLKGALKKKRVEVTAAISEKNYTKKSRVDAVLDTDTKEDFYQNNSSYISEMIDSHSDNRDDKEDFDRYEVKNSGYSQVALNRPVQSIKQKSSTLDDFLKTSDSERLANDHPVAVKREASVQRSSYESTEEKVATNNELENNSKFEARNESMQTNINEDHINKINILEKKIFELTRSVERIEEHEPVGLYQLRTTLRSLNINEHYVRDIAKKAIFELSKDDLENSDIVFEYSLREMLSSINTSLPMFSNTNETQSSVVTILLSDSSCGQTAALYKLSAMKKNSLLIQYGEAQKPHFAKDIFGLEVVKAKSIAEIISEIRKGSEAKKTIFVDFKDIHADFNETKKFVDGVKRSFAKVEVLVCLSSIHSEIYNRKVVNKFQALTSGLVVTHLDLCLDYGSLFNISYEFSGHPLMFFGTGEIVPDDVEVASGERLLAGMFKLS